MADSIGSLAVVLTATTESLSAGLNRGSAMVGKWSRDTVTTLKSVAMSAAALGGVQVAGGIVDTLGSAVSDSVKLAANFEQMKISLETMTGSTVAAGKLIDDLRKFSAASPVTFNTAADSATRLLAASIEADQVVPTLRALSSLAQGDTDKLNRLSLAYTQVKTAGRMSAEELNQIGETGVNIREGLATALGVGMDKIRDLVTAGKIGFPELVRGVKAMTEGTGRFAGATEKFGKSLTGQFEQMKDAFETTKLEFGQVLVEELGLAEATQDLSKFAERVRSVANEIRPAVRFAGDLGRAVAQVANEGGRVAGFVAQAGAGFAKAAFPGLSEGIDRVRQQVVDLKDVRSDPVSVLEFAKGVGVQVLVAADHIVEGWNDFRTKITGTLDKVSTAATRLTDWLNLRFAPDRQPAAPPPLARDVVGIPEGLTREHFVGRRIDAFEQRRDPETGLFPTREQVDRERQRLEADRQAELAKWRASFQRPKSNLVAEVLQWQISDAEHQIRAARFGLSGAAAWLDPKLVPFENAPTPGVVNVQGFRPRTDIQRAIQDYVRAMDSAIAGQKRLQSAAEAHGAIAGGVADLLKSASRDSPRDFGDLRVPAGSALSAGAPGAAGPQPVLPESFEYGSAEAARLAAAAFAVNQARDSQLDALLSIKLSTQQTATGVEEIARQAAINAVKAVYVSMGF